SYESWLKPARVKELETQGERFFPLDLATLVHEESSKLAKRMRHLAIEKGANMVVDTVLGSQSSARQLVEGLVAAGYRVEIIDVEVPEAVSREAIRQRWRDGY
ncbi:zeta toxin family protein, partial [Arachnia propionica]